MEKIEEKEAAFQKAWEAYWHQETTEAGLKKQWDQMFILVSDACLNIGKSKCYGIKVSDLDGKCLDAAMDIMNLIKKGARPGKLSSFCYLYVIGKIWSKKEIRWDRSPDASLYLNVSKYNYDFDDNNELITNIMDTHFSDIIEENVEK